MKTDGITLKRWRHYVLFAMVLLIPFYPKWLTPLVVINFIMCYFDNPKAFSIKSIVQLKPYLFIVLFYLYHIVGLLWTTNFGYAGLDAQLKLPLLLLPLTFLSGNGITTIQKHKLFNVFIYSLVFAVLLCLIRASWLYCSEGVNYFLYKDFSYYIHPGYFSMFLCFGCALIFHKLVKFSDNFISSIQLTGNLMMMGLFVAAIVLLEAKAGIFVLLFLLSIFIVFSLFKLKKFKLQLSALMLIFVGSVVYFSFYSNITSSRMAVMTSEVTSQSAAEVQSTGMRMQAWESAIELIVTNPIFGTGTGDVKDELVKVYQANGFDEIYKLRLNAHNQFLQSFASLGILGFILLVLAIGSATLYAFKSKNGLALLFLIIVVLNMLTESILEVSAGSIFFAVFFAILFSDGSGSQPQKS